MIRTDGTPTIAHPGVEIPSTREDLLELVSNVPDPVDVLAELLVRYGIDEADVLAASWDAEIEGLLRDGTP